MRFVVILAVVLHSLLKNETDRTVAYLHMLRIG